MKLTIRRFLRETTLALGLLIVCLWAVELAVRAVGLWNPSRAFRYHPVRGYELGPGLGDVSPPGFRAPEINPALSAVESASSC